MHGPPGCGKSTGAEYIAASLGMKFVSIHYNVLDKYYGEGAKKVDLMFSDVYTLASYRLKKSEKLVVFIDEVDSMFSSRDLDDNNRLSAGSGHIQAFLKQMDKFIEGSYKDKIIWVFGVNNIDVLDTAIIRDGRCNNHLYIGYPDYDMGTQYLTQYFNDYSEDDSNKIVLDIVKKTETYSFADLRNFVSNIGKKVLYDTNDSNLTIQHLKDYGMNVLEDMNNQRQSNCGNKI